MQELAQLDKNWIFNLNALRIVIGYFMKRFEKNPPGTAQNCKTLWTKNVDLVVLDQGIDTTLIYGPYGISRSSVYRIYSENCQHMS